MPFFKKSNFHKYAKFPKMPNFQKCQIFQICQISKNAKFSKNAKKSQRAQKLPNTPKIRPKILKCQILSLIRWWPKKMAKRQKNISKTYKAPYLTPSPNQNFQKHTKLMNCTAGPSPYLYQPELSNFTAGPSRSPCSRPSLLYFGKWVKKNY